MSENLLLKCLSYYGLSWGKMQSKLMAHGEEKSVGWWNQRWKNSSFSSNAQTTAASLISNINANINGEASNRVFKRRINQRPGRPSRAVLRGMGLTPSKLSCQRRSRPEVTLNPFGLNHLGPDTQMHVFGSYGPSEGVSPTCMILICTYVLFREDSIENLGLPCVFLGGCFGCFFLAVVLM